MADVGPGSDSGKWRESVLAGWDSAVVRPLVAALLAPGFLAGALVLGALQGGLSAFLRWIEPFLARRARVVYVAMPSLCLGPAPQAVATILDGLASALAESAPGESPPEPPAVPAKPGGPPHRPISRLMSQLEASLRRDRRRAILVLDDADLNRDVLTALLGLPWVGDRLRLLAGAHRAIACPLLPRPLPLLSAKQLAAMAGGRLSPQDTAELLRWSGGVPLLAWDLIVSLEEEPPSKSWLERLRGAAERLCERGDQHPYRVRLDEALTPRERSLLTDVVNRTGNLDHHPDLGSLIQLGILRRNALGGVTFVSAIVQHWMARAGQALCLCLTKEASRVLPLSEAQALLRAALKESLDEDCLIVDRLTGKVYWAGRKTHLTETPLRLVRILLENAATSRDPTRVTRYDALEGAGPASATPRAWIYDANRKLDGALGAEIITTHMGFGLSLSKDTRFLWVERLAA